MKRHDDNLRDVFDRYMPPSAPGALDDAAERVLRGLREAGPHQEIREQERVSRQRFGPRFAVAATLIVAVAIGAYAAYRSGFWSSPQAVPPAGQSPAPSERAVAETPQVAVTTPGSTTPGVGLSRREILAAQIAAAQATDTGAARPKFAVASVRPVTINRQNIYDGFLCLGVDGRWGVPGQISPGQGRCTGAVNLAELVFRTYSSYPGLPPNVEGAYEGIPRNLEIMNLQINAVADNPERVTKGELRQMVRTLLEDRLKARVHLETRQLDGYTMTIAPSGIKFKEIPADQVSGLQNMMNNGCGALRASLANWNGKCRMETLVTQLTLTLGYTPVLDKTGLTSVYDINLSLNEILTGGPAPTRGAGGGTPLPRQFSPPLPKAVEDQLGLRLERGKVPVEYVVVDHIEAPTDN